MHIKAREAYGTPNRQDQNRNSPHHVIEHPMYKTKATVKTRKRSKGRHTRITVHFPMETETQKEQDPLHAL